MTDEKKEKRKSYSPGRMAHLLKHKKSDSLSDRMDRVLVTLHLKTEDESSENTVEAIATSRRSVYLQTKESPKKSNILEQSANFSSRNFSARAIENNKKEFARSVLLAHDSIRRIKDLDDDYVKKYKDCIKEARYYYIAWILQEGLIDQRWVSCMADEEMKSLREEFENKIALLKET